MNFEILIPLKPGEGLISHGSTQFCSSNVVVFAVALQAMNNNSNKEEDEIGHLQYFFKMLSHKSITIFTEFDTLYSSTKD